MSERKKAVHYVQHTCGPQECDCAPCCNAWACEATVTGDINRVTCMNCMRMHTVAAEKKRKGVA